MKEQNRIQEMTRGAAPWRLWGPYLSERQWGTVREDYSPDGRAWDYISHEHARSQAYRWGEDGIAGFSDDQQRLCLALALWNERDPILKERFFGLTNGEGNHGEDVKELYYYVDATPSHSYLKMLYKYPQRPFPYSWLVDENRRRGTHESEFELLDTDAFDKDRYFDIFVEYAKGDPTDILMLITVHNRGPEDAVLHVLPQLWFRNTWSWGYDSLKPSIESTGDGCAVARHKNLGGYGFHADGDPVLLFCDNETNVRRLYGWDRSGYIKDAFHDYVVHGNADAVSPKQCGTKTAAHYRLSLPPRGESRLRIRLSTNVMSTGFADFDEILRDRRTEADEFYADLQQNRREEDLRRIQRQAFAGIIWGKQFFYYDVPQWNHEWTHLNNADVISMPDKREFPWYAAWDLAFHA